MRELPKEATYADIGRELAAGLAHGDKLSTVYHEGTGTVFAIRGEADFMIGSTWAPACWNDLDKFVDGHRSDDPLMNAISTEFSLAMNWETEEPIWTTAMNWETEEPI